MTDTQTAYSAYLLSRVTELEQQLAKANSTIAALRAIAYPQVCGSGVGERGQGVAAGPVAADSAHAVTAGGGSVSVLSDDYGGSYGGSD